MRVSRLLDHQLFRIQASAEAQEMMRDKPGDYVKGFHDGCEWLNEYVKAMLEKISETPTRPK